MCPCQWMEVAECSSACPGSWEASRWAGHHTCRARAPEQLREFEVFSHGTSSVLYDDMVGPEGSLEGPFYGGRRTTVWTSANWQLGFASYNFRQEAPSAPSAPKASTTTSKPLYWAARKRRRKEKRKKRPRSKVKPADSPSSLLDQSSRGNRRYYSAFHFFIDPYI